MLYVFFLEVSEKVCCFFFFNLSKPTLSVVVCWGNNITTNGSIIGFLTNSLERVF